MSIADHVVGTKVALFVTHRCNLRCRYCYNGRAFDRSMPWRTARRAVDFAFEQTPRGFLLLSFFGGEPLLESELLARVVAYAHAEAPRRGRPLFFSLATNATLLDARRLDLLAANRFRVQVSVDGCAEAHDANRRYANGRPTWPRVSANLRRLVEAGLDVHVAGVVDPRNARLLARSFDALRALGVRQIHLAPNLRADWDDDGWAGLEEGLAALGDAWAASLRAGEGVRLDPLHGMVLTHLRQGLDAPLRCAFGTHEFAVSPRGRIYPCDRIVKADDDDGMCLGDLDSGLDPARQRAVVAARDHVEPECAACELRERCMHRCGCYNYESTGHPGRVSPLLCRWERAVIATADRVANTLWAERSPEFLRRFYATGAAGRAP
jgi:uncharacterized protein